MTYLKDVRVGHVVAIPKRQLLPWQINRFGWTKLGWVSPSEVGRKTHRSPQDIEGCEPGLALVTDRQIIGREVLITAARKEKGGGWRKFTHRLSV